MELPITEVATVRHRGARVAHYLRRNAVELIVYAGCFVGLLPVLLAADAFDSFYKWSRRYESWEADEIFLALCAMGIVSFAFVLRRWVLEYRDKRKIVKLTVDLREALRAAKVADEAKSAFLANLSHELRTPLNTINGYAEMMESGIMGPIDARYAGYARDIRESGEHLLAIINGILDLTRVASGALDLRCSEMDLCEVTRNTFKDLAAQADAKDIELENCVPADFPAIVADAQRIRQVLANLVANAIKFSPPGRHVVVAAARGRDSVSISVRDQGIGMDPKELPRIVEPFVQLDCDFSREQEGAGLGLALVKRFVELHGGTLAFETASGKGTTVSVTLPQAAAAPLLTRAAGS
jgi:signal transduction histidine kinase